MPTTSRSPSIAIAILSTVIVIAQGIGIAALIRVTTQEDAILRQIAESEARIARLEAWKESYAATVDRRLAAKDSIDQQILDKLESHMLNDTRRFNAIPK